MRIFVAIMICGRPKYTALSARSLPRGYGTTIHVFPDRCEKSNELSQLYLPAVIHSIPTRRLGADENIKRAVGTFIRSKDDVVVLLDSDGLLARHWVKDLRAFLPFTMGILGLYNSDAHQTIGKQSHHLCKKRDVGSFGLAMTQSRAIEAFNARPGPRAGFDWGFSHYFQQHSIELIVFCDSRLLHYGAWGQNSKPKSLREHGVNFIDKDNPYYAKAMSFQRGA